MSFSAIKHPPRWALWLLAAALSLGAACCLGYYWRVFYYLDARGVSGARLTLYLGALALAAVAGAWAVSRLRSFASRGAACVFLCGLVFVFASAPLQAPDEVQHYLRAYSVSQGYFDFDAERTYPEDVARLVAAFPGAWVNSHTSTGLVRDEKTGEEKVYDTTGYALKQYGEGGRVESIADSFALYRNGSFTPEPVTEPILFMVLPFVFQAAGIALARLLGLGALGCLYAGRAANLAVYALLCRAALRRCRKSEPLFLAVMLCPLSLYMAASMSYDAALLGCYYLMAALFAGEDFGTREALIFLAAFTWVNMSKPWINLLWRALPLALPKAAYKARLKKWQLALAALACALAVTAFTSWYGSAFRYHYGTIGRMLDGVAQLPQLRFVLAYPLRFAAILVGTLYENDLFLGQLGTFGSLDLPVELIDHTAGAMLLLGALLSVGEKPARTAPARWAALGFALVYTAGCMTAMYITYTPVGMIRIIGLQARYFLPVFLLLFWLAAQGLSALGRPRFDQGVASGAKTLSLLLFGGYALVGGLLLFQHYFIGPVYTIG